MNEHKMSNKDLTLLHNSGCPWFPHKLDKVVIKELVRGEDVSEGLFDEGAFHPNGNSGCVVMNDEYICDIRCEHLIWICGWHEHYGQTTKISKDKDRPEWEDYACSCVMLVGNHKGNLVVSLIYEE